MSAFIAPVVPSPKQHWLLQLLLAKRLSSSLLCLPRELLYQIIVRKPAHQTNLLGSIILI
jgi:hypothetical protein